MTKATRPRNIANDILDAVESATSKWTRQKKSEERHPGMRRYRRARMTREPRCSQKEAASQVMKAAYLAASANTPYRRPHDKSSIRHVPRSWN